MSHSSNKNILYIKGDSNTEVQHRSVMLKDILTIECSDKHLEYQIKVLKIYQFPEKGQHRTVISILKVIQCIHEKYPDLPVENLGPTDLILTYENTKPKNKLLEYLKVSFIAGIVFFGAAFCRAVFEMSIPMMLLESV